jgi:UDP-3-O-[3-hydroxymyristoyl] glucosamine N-acyltransferase
MADSIFFAPKGPFTLAELARIAEAELVNAPNNALEFANIGPLSNSDSSIVSFLHNRKYVAELEVSSAGACVLAPAHVEKAPPGMALLVSRDPHRSFALIGQAFFPEELAVPGISDDAIIHASASIGEGCEIEEGAVVRSGAVIGPRTKIKCNAVIGRGVVLGDDCVIGENVSISHSLIGNRVVVLAGAQIGQRGFGFAMSAAGFVKVPQVGRVVVGNDVEIGANTTIDRGSAQDTIIGDGCMLDNLVQIGHNARMGKNCVLVAHCSLAGSVKLGDFVVMGGHSSVNGHVFVADGTQIGPMSGVMGDTSPGDKIGGAPAVDLKEFWRRQVAIAKLTRKK